MHNKTRCGAYAARGVWNRWFAAVGGGAAFFASLGFALTIGSTPARAAAPAGGSEVATVSSPGIRASAGASATVPGSGTASSNEESSDAVGCRPALTSGLTGMPLKSQAARITDLDTVEALVRPLRQLAAVQGGVLSSVEVLGWGAGGTDKPLSPAKAQAVMGEVKSALQSAGFAYALPMPTHTEGQTAVTLLTATRPAQSGGAAKSLIGFWIKTDHALLLAWGTVEPATTTGSASSSLMPAAPAAPGASASGGDAASPAPAATAARPYDPRLT